MCGIAGRFNPAGLPPDPEWHTKADALLAHRGPDGNGYYSDPRCELVHRRLALIDLSPTGHQPMSNEDGNIQVNFNGEIYNYRALRAGLIERGHTFRGTSDCEVLPHLYEEYGAEMVELLRGMFAFAIYDRTERRLLLARDRFGIKPLYYVNLGMEHAFASEIKALLALKGLRATLNRQACYDFLGLGYVPEPATAFSEIKALPPGSSLLIGPQGAKLTRYYRVRTQPDFTLTSKAAVDDLAHRLTGAVERQMVADVPVAAFLSGGIDSSLVVAAHSRKEGDPLRTFNVQFPDESYDETKYADATSKHCGTQHETVRLTGRLDDPDEIIKLLLHFDQPFADTSLIPTYYVCRAVRERGLKCALSGDGGDEAFGGYAQFWRARWFQLLGRMPSPLQSLSVALGEGIGRFAPDRGRQLALAAGMAQQAHGNMPVLVAMLSNYVRETEKETLVRLAARETLLPVYGHFDGFSPSSSATLEDLSARMTENLFNLGLLSDMLRKVDMMSMRTSIEVRVPLLDEDLVNLGLSLPHALKADGHQGKLILRGLAERWLPRQVAQHPKQGFRIPLDRLLPAGIADQFQDLLLSAASRSRPIFEASVVERWISLFRRSQQGHVDRTVSREGLYQRMMFLVALEVWMREHRMTW